MTRPRLPRPPTLATVVLLVALLGACAGEGFATLPPAAAPSAVPSPTATTAHGEWPATEVEVEQPPPFEVRHAGEALLIYPHSFCNATGCADGADEHPPSVGSPAEVYVRVPVATFTELRVSGAPVDNRCAEPADEYAVEPLGEGWWRVTPRGAADERRVTLFADGGDGSGSMGADLRWTTPPGDAPPTTCQ
ncbi:hypothetical protein GCM10009809_35920 [Isoptericola hypogeus]|uniref:Lipoprotein n=1 Tax=Isoptericola hypogeus TaxID=300179 RepID=A0ABP4VV44_9MICO